MQHILQARCNLQVMVVVHCTVVGRKKRQEQVLQAVHNLACHGVTSLTCCRLCKEVGRQVAEAGAVSKASAATALLRAARADRTPRCRSRCCQQVPTHQVLCCTAGQRSGQTAWQLQQVLRARERWDVANQFCCHAAGRKNGQDARWLQQVRRSGTTADKVAALTLLVQESAVANLKALDSLLVWVQKRKGGKDVVRQVGPPPFAFLCWGRWQSVCWGRWQVLPGQGVLQFLPLRRVQACNAGIYEVFHGCTVLVLQARISLRTEPWEIASSQPLRRPCARVQQAQNRSIFPYWDRWPPSSALSRCTSLADQGS